MLISRAQNFEDVILWRALKHVANGFYIDIGAQDPVVDSVSLAFYEKGWRGVHVEPTAAYADRLRMARPDEVVIEAAVGANQGSLAFYEIPETGLSTGSAEIAKSHRDSGYKIEERTVPVVPLAEILDRYEERDVHWLKIDVEGMEPSVLTSWSPSDVRPWIVVVESTRPLSQESSETDWEELLLEKGYDYVYFDGVNRFYISDKRRELAGEFGPGPNLFDEFSLTAESPYTGQVTAERDEALEKLATASEEAHSLHLSLELSNAQAEALNEERQVLLHKIDVLGAEREALEASIQILEKEKAQETQIRVQERLAFERLLASKSWRLTAPLRWIHLFIRRAATVLILIGQPSAMRRKIQAARTIYREDPKQFARFVMRGLGKGRTLGRVAIARPRDLPALVKHVLTRQEHNSTIPPLAKEQVIAAVPDDLHTTMTAYLHQAVALRCDLIHTPQGNAECLRKPDTASSATL